ncbi:YuiA family protein [Salipaludibacillus sp. CF4.18]
MALDDKKLNENDCEYCTGKGYNQLLLGGSETCAGCLGSGKKQQSA